MALRTKNIARGGGKGGVFKADIQGLKELERKLKALRMDSPEITAELFGIVGGAADDLRDRMRSAARSAGWGSQKTTVQVPGQNVMKPVTGDDAIDTIFSYDTPRGGSGRQRISALAGVAKKRTMIVWRAARHPQSPKAQRRYPELVAESFASMLEFGTTRMPARPAIRSTIEGAKQSILDKLSEGYKALVEKYSR